MSYLEIDKLHMDRELKTVSGLDWVRKNEDRLLTFDHRGLELASKLICDVMILVGNVQAFRDGDWWVIGSDHDWIENTPKHSVQEIFSQVIPFPEAGDNSMRSEILLFCFAQDVATLAEGNLAVIKGSDDVKSLAEALNGRSEIERWVMFRV